MGNKAFSEVLSLTRSTGASRVDETGKISYIDPNEPRYEFTSASPSNQNHLTFSEQFDDSTASTVVNGDYWSKARAQIISYYLQNTEEFDSGNWAKNGYTNSLLYSEQYDNAVWTKGTANNLLKSSEDFANTSNWSAVATNNQLTYTDQIENAAWTKNETNVQQNLLKYSEDLTQVDWNKNAILAFGSGSVSNQIAAPDGNITADYIVEDNTSNPHGVRQNISVAANTVYTMSFYAKAGTRTRASAWQFPITPLTETSAAFYDFTTGTCSGVGTPTMVAVAGNSGWFRCTKQFYTNSAGTVTIHVGPQDASTSQVYTGDGVSGIYVWGVQVVMGIQEQGNIWGSPQNYENAAWSKTNANIQTNYKTYSEDFTNASWTKDDYVQTNHSLYSEDFTNANWGKSNLAVQTNTNLLTYSQDINNAVWSKNSVNLQQNLITYSEDMSNAAWSNSNLIITSNVPATLAPDGTSTADKLVATNGSTNSGLYRLVPNATSNVGVTYALSAYLKAGEHTYASLQFAGAGFSPSGITVFNLSNGTITSGLGTISSAGNGWYRCTVLGVPSSNIGIDSNFYIQPRTSIGTSVTGDGTSGFYVWGVQVIQANQPNMLATANGLENDTYWSKNQTFIQRNLILQSQTFDTGWTRTGINAFGSGSIANAIAAPDTTTTADFIQPGTATTDQQRLFQLVTGELNTPYTFSAYFKATGTYTKVAIREANATGAYVAYDLSNQTLLSSTGMASPTITSAGNGWYRISGILNTSGSNNWAHAIHVLSPSYTTGDPAAVGNQWTGNGTDGVYVWGAQLVKGSVVGDYVATTTAALPVLYNAFDGTLKARKICESNTTSQHYWYHSATIGAGLSYTYSICAKAGEKTTFDIIMPTGFNPSNAGFTFNLSAGTLVNNNNQGSGSITALGNGWYRCSVTQTATLSPGSAAMYMSFGNLASYVGNGNDGIYVSDAKLIIDEQNIVPVAGEYTPTTSAVANILEYAPDGTKTAQKITENATNNIHGVTTTYAGYTSGTVYTHSVYAKAGEKSKFLFAFGTTAFTAYPQATFDLTSGTISNQTATTAVITPVGNGWYRCSITATASATASDNLIIQMMSGTSNSYAGDGYSGMYFWGAQITVGNATSVPYAATTSTAVGVNVIAADGYSSATRIVDTATSISHAISHAAISGLIAGAEYTQVIYAKAGEVQSLALYPENSGNGAIFNLSTGIVTSVDPGISRTSIVSVGNGWYRIAASRVIPGTSVTPYMYMCNPSTTYTSAGGGLYIWGHQFIRGREQTISSTNLITNGTFDTNTTGWTTYQSSATAVNGRIEVTTTTAGFASVYQSINVTAGKYYKLTVGYTQNGVGFPYGNPVAATNMVSVISSSQGSIGPVNVTDNKTAFIFRAPADGNISVNLYVTPATSPVGQKAVFDDISLVEYPMDYVKTTSAALPIQFCAPTSDDASLIHVKTASKYSEIAAAGTYHRIVYAIPFLTGPHTLSIYAKAAERNWIAISNATDGASAFFNLTTGTIGTTTGCTAAITSIGSGWYRCSITFTIASAASKTVGYYLASADNTAIYNGDGYSGAYFWGAQLVLGSVPGDYQVTTATAAPVLYRAPDYSLTAQKIMEDTTASSVHMIQQGIIALNPGLQKQANQYYIATVYAKPGERTKFSIQFSGVFNVGNVYGNYTLSGSGSTSVTGHSSGRAYIQTVGNGWYKCTLIAQAANDNLGFNTFITVNDAGGFNTYTGDGSSGMYFWGAELRQYAQTNNSYNLLSQSVNIENITEAPANGSIHKNLLTRSEEIQSIWGVNNTPTITRKAGTAPNGSNTATQIFATAGGNGAYRTFTSVSGKYYTWSAYVKYLNGNATVQLGCDNSPTNANLYFNFSTGAITFTGAGIVSSGVTNVGGGWYRVYGTYLSTGTTNVLTIYSLGYQNFLTWGAQVVEGKLPGNYQQTTSDVRTVKYLGPDKTYSAIRYTEDTTNGGHYINTNNGTAYAVAGSYLTASAYFKLDSASLATRYAGLFIVPQINAVYAGASYNLTNGTVTVTSDSVVDATIQSVGDGWYRCSITSKVAVTGSYNVQLRCHDATAASSTTGILGGYQGDGVSGLFMYGPQVTAAGSYTTLSDYVRTFSTSSYNLGNGAYAATGASAGSPILYPNPDHTGIVATRKIADSPASQAHILYYNGIPTTAGANYIWSAYVKAGDIPGVQVRYENSNSTALVAITVNLLDGTNVVTTFGTISGTSGLVTSVGNGWYRISVAFTAVDTAAKLIIFPQQTYSTSTNSYIGSGCGIYVWGAQFEGNATAGVPTTYLQNLGSSVNMRMVTILGNSILYNEDYTNANWTKTNLTVSGTTTTFSSPRGSVTVNKLVENAGTGTKQLYQNTQYFEKYTPYTFSFYATTGGRNYIHVATGTGFDAGSVVFNISNGTIFSVSGMIADVRAEILGSGWARYSVSAYCTQTTSTFSNMPGFDIRPSVTGTDSGSYTGDGTSGIYLWGVMLNRGLMPADYQQTTTIYSVVVPPGTLSRGVHSFTTVAQKMILTNRNVGTASPYYAITQVSGATTALTYTFSVYAKAAELTKFGLRIDDTGSNNTITAGYNLATGTVDVAAAGTGGTSSISATITHVTEGWYRCTLTGTWASMAAVRGLIRLRDAAGNFGQFDGDGTSGMMFYGSQLEPGSIASPYLTTTSAAGSQLSTTMEQNYFLNSEQLQLWNAPSNATVSADQIANPVNAAINADKLVENSAASQYHFISQNVSGLPNIQNNPYKFSIWVKAGERSKFTMKFQDSSGTSWVEGSFDVSAGTAAAGLNVGLATNATTEIVNWGNGWYRCAVSGKLNMIGFTTVNVAIFMSDATSIVYNGDGVSGMYFWGAQLTTGNATSPLSASNYAQTGASTPAIITYQDPYGSGIARKLIGFATPTESTGSNAQGTGPYISQRGISTSANYYSSSIYAKAGEFNSIKMMMRGQWGNAANQPAAWFNLATGTASGALNCTTSITSVGAGWYRCSIYSNNVATAGSDGWFDIYAGHNAADVVGDGVSGVYIWGAMHNQGGVVPTYVRTTTSTITFFTSVVPSSKNLLKYSQDFTQASAYTIYGSVTSTAATTAPDGTLTANLLTNTTGAGDRVIQELTVTNSGPYTLSVYLKAATSTTGYILLRNPTVGVNLAQASFNLSTGTIISTGTLTPAPNFITSNATITAVGNGWYRCTLSVSGGVLAGENVRVYIYNSGDLATVGASVYAWGAQLTQTNNEDYVATGATASTTAQYTAPPAYGTQTAEKLIVTGTPWATSLASLSRNWTAGPYTLSVYAKANGAQFIQLLWNSSLNNTSYANFDLVNGTVSGGSYLAATISNEGNGWYRCSFTCNLASASGSAIYYIIPNGVIGRGGYTTAGMEGQAVYVWGASATWGPGVAAYQTMTTSMAPILFTAPDGTTTAQRLCEDATLNSHQIYQSVTTTVPLNTYYTFSVYAKTYSGARNICLTISDNTTGEVFYRYDLTSGVASYINNSGSLSNHSGTMTPVGNGWYRCVITAKRNTGTSLLCKIYLIDSGTNPIYTGDGTGSVLIWGAQAATFPYATPYLKTTLYKRQETSSNVVARGISSENSRTNFVQYSQDFTNAYWSGTYTSRITLIPNSIIAPDGTMTGCKVLKNSTSPSPDTVFSRPISGATATQSPLTLSVFVKAGVGGTATAANSTVSKNYLNFLIYDTTTASVVGSANFYTDNGQVNAVSPSTHAVSTPYANGWYRISFTAPSFTTIGGNITIYLGHTGGPEAVAGDYYYIWGVQLERGKSATSYIPTAGSTVTRASDVLTIPSYSPWANTSGGTFYAEVTPGEWQNDNDDHYTISTNPNVSPSYGLARFSGGGFNIYDGTNYGALPNMMQTDQQTRKVAFSYQTNLLTANAAVNGVSGTYTLPTANFVNASSYVRLGQNWNGYFKVFKYYPAMKSQPDLATLTTV